MIQREEQQPDRDRVLLVEDDPALIELFEAFLHGQPFDVVSTTDPRAALTLVESGESFPVLVTDLAMPWLGGLELVERVERRNPDTVCVILTGNADLKSALRALNDGHIFRFLTKPCPRVMLTGSIEAALAQHRLVRAERDVLETTLAGCVAMLSEILSLLNPPAFGSAARVKRYAAHIAERLGVEERWQLEMAALLCRLGCIVVPPELLDKAFAGSNLTTGERELLDSHAAVGAELLAKIPRFAKVAAMIAGQNRGMLYNPKSPDPVALGSQILHVTVEFDRLVLLGRTPAAAVATLRKRGGVWPPVLDALGDVEVDLEPGDRVRKIGVAALRPGMIFEQDVRARNGLLLVARGQEVTLAVARRLEGFARGLGVNEPFQVRVPAPLGEAARPREAETDSLEPVSVRGEAWDPSRTPPTEKIST